MTVALPLKRILSIFFVISIGLTVLMPVQYVHAQTQGLPANPSTEEVAPVATPTELDRETQRDLEKQLEKYCGANPATWFTGCIVEAFFGISARILSIAGWVFDGFLWFSLDNTIFLNQGFIGDIWDDIKDLANAGFILGLIYLSYLLIIKGNGDQKWKKMIVKLVLIALLINFSLFITRVFIDVGNITALTFYNALDIREDAERGSQIAAGLGDRVERKSVAGAIIQKFNPAKVVSTEVFQTINERTGDGAVLPGQAGQVGVALNAADRGGIYGAITLLMFGFIIMNIMAAWLLIKGGVFFVSRALWLIVLSVISPLAFVAYFFPSGEKWFQSWFKTLVDKCFCLPVYFFFIWLLLSFLDAVNQIFDSELSPEQSGWKLVLVGVTIQFILVYALLSAATKASKKMCDGATINGKSMSIGDAAWSGMKKVGVAAVPGLALRGTAGRLGYSMTQSARLSEMATSKNGLRRFVGNVGLGAGNTLKDTRFGLQKGAADRIDQRKDQLKNQMNRDTNNLKGSLKDKDGRIVTKANIEKEFNASDASNGLSGEARADALKKFQKGLEEERGLKKITEEEARDRAVTRARGSGIVGFVKSGALPISEREAAEEFEKKNKKDAEKRQKTNQIRDEVSQLAREAGIQENEIKNAARRAAAAAISENGDVDGMLATLFAKVERALQTPDRNPDGSAVKVDVLDKDGKPKLDADGKTIQTIQKSINSDTKKELEDSHKDVLAQINEIKASDLDKGEQTRQIKELVSSAGGIGTAAIKGNLRTEQNAVNSRIRNVQDETQAFLDQVATGLAIDANIYGTGAETFKDNQNVGYEQRKKEEDDLKKEWLARSNADDSKSKADSSSDDTSKTDQSKADKVATDQAKLDALERKRSAKMDKWTKMDDEGDDARMESLLAISKDGFERISRSILDQAVKSPAERDMTIIKNEFKDIPASKNLNFDSLANASTDEFHDVLTDALSANTKPITN